MTLLSHDTPNAPSSPQKTRAPRSNNRHDDVVECAVIGVRDDLKGMVPLAFVVVSSSSSSDSDDDVSSEVVSIVRDRVGAVAALRNVLVVKALPKTRSGKILRKTMRSIADGDAFRVPGTIEDAKALDDIQDAVDRLNDAAAK